MPSTCGLRSATGLENLGIELDDQRNQHPELSQGVVSRDGSRVRVLVIPTDEEGVIAEDTYHLVSQEELM